MKKLLLLSLYCFFAFANKQPMLSLWDKIFWKYTNKENYLKKAIFNKNKKRAIAAIKAGANINLAYESVNSFAKEPQKITMAIFPIMAIENNWPDVFELMIEYGVDIKDTGVFMSLVSHRWHTIVKRLINAGANVNCASKSGATPLMMANDEKMIKILLNCGAAVDTRDNEGWSAIHWQSFSSRKNNVQLLIEYGANVNAQNNNGDTPLHLVGKGFSNDDDVTIAVDTAKLLIAAGADINIKNKDGDVPLTAHSFYTRISYKSCLIYNYLLSLYPKTKTWLPELLATPDI